MLFVKRFYPGTKSGGPTTSSLTLACRYQKIRGIKLKIVTTDRDVGDSEPYEICSAVKNVELDFASVSYLDTSKLSGLWELVNLYRKNLIVLNSVFDPLFGVLLPLLTTSDNDIYLFARGELQMNSLSIKPFKKRVFLKLLKNRILKRCILVFSSVSEKEEAERSLRREIQRFEIVPNIPQRLDLKEDSNFEARNALRVLYLGRIEEDKNLLFLLEALKDVQRPLSLDIYGAIRDDSYWGKCLDVVKSLPKHINVEYKGELERAGISRIGSRYSYLINPSKSENYGHSIAEALSVGLKAIVSQGTPWEEIGVRGIGHFLGFDKQEWVQCLNGLESYDLEEKRLDRIEQFENLSIIRNSIAANDKFLNKI